MDLHIQNQQVILFETCSKNVRKCSVFIRCGVVWCDKDEYICMLIKFN